MIPPAVPQGATDELDAAVKWYRESGFPAQADDAQAELSALRVRCDQQERVLRAASVLVEKLAEELLGDEDWASVVTFRADVRALSLVEAEGGET